MKKKTKLKHCPSCKKKKEDVKVRIDPYTYELWNRKEKIRLCSACFHERMMDI